MRAFARMDVRPWVALTLGLLAGVAGEGLLFTWAQCREVEERLAADFRLLAFVPEDLAEDRRTVVREQLTSDPHVLDAVWVDRDTALKSLGEQDPELARSVALLGRNPLPSAFELVVAADGLSRVGDLAGVAAAVPEVSRVEYKRWQAQAILEARAWRRLIALVGAVALWTAALAGFVLALPALPAPEKAGEWLKDAAPSIGWGAFGAALGLGAVLGLSIPLRAEASFWMWPPAWGQAAVLAAGAVGGWVSARLLP